MVFAAASVSVANPLIGKCKTPSGESEGSINYGFSNFGTDEEPEYVFGFFIDYDNDDDVDEIIWLSENAEYVYLPQQNFMENIDLAIVKDSYNFLPAGKLDKIIRICAYGANIEGKDFEPVYILVTLYSAQADKVLGTIWIPYDEEAFQELRATMDTAIRELGIRERK